MKTILVPTEQTTSRWTRRSNAALLLAREIRRLHRRFPAAAGRRRYGGDGPRRRLDHGRGQGERRRNGAARRGDVPRLHAKPRNVPQQSGRDCAARPQLQHPLLRGRGTRPRPAATTLPAATAASSTSSCWRARARNGRARRWSRSNPPVRKRTSGADRAADFAALARHQHPDRLEPLDRAGARHRVRHAAPARRARSPS